MLVLEDSVLRHLAKRSAIVVAFPFLGELVKSSKCNCRRDRVDMGRIKAQIASLDPAGKQKFKLLAGAERVRVVLRTGNKTQVVEF